MRILRCPFGKPAKLSAVGPVKRDRWMDLGRFGHHEMAEQWRAVGTGPIEATFTCEERDIRCTDVHGSCPSPRT